MKVLIIYMALVGFSAGTLDLAPLPNICYTQWFDLDDPTNGGDFETLCELRAAYPGKICPKPISIEAATLSGVPAANTGQVFLWYDLVKGFACVSSQQKNGECCLDYKVRFRCLCPWPPIKDPVLSIAETPAES